MTDDRSKVAELIKTSGEKLQALIKERWTSVPVILKSLERVKKGKQFEKDTWKQKEMVRSASSCFICVPPSDKRKQSILT